VASLTEEGWFRYDNADYETSLEMFNQALDIQADHAEGYVGVGWVSLGTGDLSATHTAFDFAMVSTFYVGDDALHFVGQPDVAVRGENSPIDTVGGAATGRWTIRPLHLPVLGVVAVSAQVVDTTTGFALVSGPLTLTTFTDSTLTVARDALFDTVTVGRLETRVDYYYYSAAETWTQLHADAYVANACAYQAEDQDMMAIVMANAALGVRPQYAFAHYPEVTARRLHLMLAQCYYNLQYYDRSLDEVYLVPEHAELNPDSPTFLYDLQHEIERLLAM
jgi:tetratricopeptide (TPR) repeat protein